jgi:ABC-type dipeptide/oligopeptide/nickel transport system permease subunit
MNEASVETPWRRTARRFVKNKTAVAGLAFLLLVSVVVLLASVISPYKQSAQDLTLINTGPSAHHLLGTDDVGRDILSRIIYGGRVSMEVCVVVVILAVLIALPLGLLTGYIGGVLDSVIMRIMDAIFTFPGLILALAVAALLGPSVSHAAIAIAIPFVPGFVRVIRAQVLAVREETFVEASRSVGVNRTRMLRKHIFPNVASPLIVQVALSFGYALLAEAGLSFLGFGVQPPNSSWGTMLESAYQHITDKPWPLIPPGLAIMFTVLAFNLIGDGLRDSLGREVFVVKGEPTAEVEAAAAGTMAQLAGPIGHSVGRQ